MRDSTTTITPTQHSPNRPPAFLRRQNREEGVVTRRERANEFEKETPRLVAGDEFSVGRWFYGLGKEEVDDDHRPGTGGACQNEIGGPYIAESPATTNEFSHGVDTQGALSRMFDMEAESATPLTVKPGMNSKTRTQASSPHGVTIWEQMNPGSRNRDDSLTVKGRKSTGSRGPGNAEDVDRPKLHYAQGPTTRSGAVDAHSRPDLRKPIDSPLKFVAELDHCGTRTWNSRQCLIGGGAMEAGESAAPENNPRAGPAAGQNLRLTREEEAAACIPEHWFSFARLEAQSEIVAPA
ncbi:hypothetical protein FB451DRAFT_1363199 [Mycena latifolia]|nr:hypothetical protein FB451DRAFT_1363199 [Mycena latifolia]